MVTALLASSLALVYRLPRCFAPRKYKASFSIPSGRPDPRRAGRRRQRRRRDRAADHRRPGALRFQRLAAVLQLPAARDRRRLSDGRPWRPARPASSFRSRRKRDSIRVTGSAIDVPASQQGTSVSVITSQEIRERNEAQTVDLLRELPGFVFSQNGGRGAVADLFVRGGDSKYNLVELNGIPINSFYFGGLFDFSQIPSDFVSRDRCGARTAIGRLWLVCASAASSTSSRAPRRTARRSILSPKAARTTKTASPSAVRILVHGWGLAGSLSSL